MKSTCSEPTIRRWWHHTTDRSTTTNTLWRLSRTKHLMITLQTWQSQSDLPTQMLTVRPLKSFTTLLTTPQPLQLVSNHHAEPMASFRHAGENLQWDADGNPKGISTCIRRVSYPALTSDATCSAVSYVFVFSFLFSMPTMCLCEDMLNSYGSLWTRPSTTM